ncbi:ABC transporter ATP-binding protein [Pseudonocardia sp. N23]|uniref:ABC transporter ATP-binding protein n=1 Tax=Pseudonocardia sp. N23 TaxID=1987376 RepID=UPI000BFDCBA2|nr:ABC transporter ATP-binding protein [Pseudonocardia sp. N23]GAY08280.1 transport ATP-binding protein CydCD [Pseudonocardia sp. N23]
MSAPAEARPAAAPAPPTGTPAGPEVRSRRGVALRLAARIYGRELARHKLLTGTALLMPAMGNIALSYLPPLAVAALVDRLASGGGLTVATVTPLVVGFFLSLLVGEACWRVGIHCLNRTDARGIEHLYVEGMDALLAKDAAFFHENFAGALTKRVLSFASRYEDFVDTLAFQIVAQLLPLTFASVVLWHYDPWLVAVLVGMIVVSAVTVVPLIRRRQALVEARETAWTRLSGHVADTLTNMDAVRAYASELREAAEHRRRVAEHKRLTLRAWDYNNLRIDTIVAPLSVITNVAGLVLALLVAIRTDGPGVAAVVVTVAYFTQATKILFDFNQTYRHLERSLTEAAQFAELLLDDPTVVDHPEPEPLAGGPAGVVLERVRFTHSGRHAPLFDGLDLSIAPGERVGLVGRSGGGKTTIIRLLLRLMDIQEGRLLVGGQDVARMSQADLRGMIAHVPQDPAMFHRTLRENIAFGRPDATDDDILAAAQAAHVVEFVEGLPDGFDTLVGERGVKLSGGQRQRVAIARAILRDAPILLLDEATSALDSESEALIQRALWRLMEGRTAIAVAHRLSTVAGMDRLIVIDRGRVVEEGSHAELLTRGGGYARLWERQSGGFLSE